MTEPSQEARIAYALEDVATGLKDIAHAIETNGTPQPPDGHTDESEANESDVVTASEAQADAEREPHLTAEDTATVMKAYQKAGAPTEKLSFKNRNHEIVVEDDYQDMSDDERQAYRDAEDKLGFVSIDWAETDDGKSYPEKKYVEADDMDKAEARVSTL